MPCGTKRDKRLWEESQKLIEEAKKRRKEKKEKGIKEPMAYRMSIFKRMKERVGGSELPKKKAEPEERKLAASSDEHIKLAIRLHNSRKNRKLKNDLKKSKDPYERDQIKFVLRIIKKTRGEK